MRFELKPYPSYETSNEKWLGSIPSYWYTRRTKTLLTERKQKGYPDLPLLAATQTKGVVRKEDYDSRTVVAQKDLHLLKRVEVGDFVISLRSFQGGIEYARYEGIISPAYTVLHTKDEDTQRYLAWLFKSFPYIQNLQSYVTGIRQGQNIDYTKLGRSAVPLPPEEDRRAISSFLDYIDRRIRKYIRAKKKLIALLEEYKQAIINQAVTGQIDVRTGKPYPAYMDSGVEWLGKIPEHWEVKRLRNLAEMRVSNIDKQPKEEELPVQLCNYTDVYKNDCIRMSMDFMRATARQTQIERFRLSVGDVLITKDSEAWNDIGVPALVKETARDLVSGYHLALLRPLNSSINGGFLFRAIQSTCVKYQFHINAHGVTRYGLSHSSIKSIWLQVPQPDEQKAIVKYIDSHCEKVNRSIESSRRSIELLKEFLTCLISDVVTGKIDVRDIAAKLPDEEDTELPELDDALDEAIEEMEDEVEEEE